MVSVVVNAGKSADITNCVELDCDIGNPSITVTVNVFANGLEGTPDIVPLLKVSPAGIGGSMLKVKLP